MQIIDSPETIPADRMSHKTSLRRLSNVAQALENLVVQCGVDDEFRPLSTWADHQLRRVRNALLKEIHD